MADGVSKRSDYELTKHISLGQVDPRSLRALRTRGRCTVDLAEELFDMDCPGHYFRRVRSVAVSLVRVAGPETSINCTLALLQSRIRCSSLVLAGTDGYTYRGDGDKRFSEHRGRIVAIVKSDVAHGSGPLADRRSDERHLPFEGAGVIGEWQLALPADAGKSGYSTVADIILHLQYTARDGGAPLRRAAAAKLAKHSGTCRPRAGGQAAPEPDREDV